MNQRDRALLRNNTTDEAIKLRRARAIELRVQGRKNMRQIAKELGVSVATICNDIRAVVNEETEGVADLIKTTREIECQKLDDWQAKVLTSLDNAKDVDDEAKLYGLLVRIAERRAKLLGLDAPIKQEIDATIGSAPRTAASARAMMNALFATSAEQSLGASSDEDDELPN